jgi:hypothetical protein
MSDLNCLPLFTKMDLVPSNLNFSFQEWHFLPLHEFNEKAEELRNYIINQVFASGHNFFSGNLTLHQIEYFQKIY